MNRQEMDRIRVASLQYFIRPVQTFEQFRDQVEGLVDTAKDYKCQLLVFPEYFTVQLLTLGNVKRPIHEQIRDLANQVPRYVEMMSKLAKKNGMYIVAGTIPDWGKDKEQLHNTCYFFNRKGEHQIQRKNFMTRFETEEWFVKGDDDLKVFETSFGRVAISICYDVQFPELIRAAAHADAHVLIVPSCTDERQGFLRVRYCAQARAIENQMYVIQSPTVGSLPMVPAVSLNYGQAAIFTPSDFPFARDGILAEGVPNQESMVIGEINLKTIEEARSSGTVLQYQDSRRSAGKIYKPEVFNL